MKEQRFCQKKNDFINLTDEIGKSARVACDRSFPINENPSPCAELCVHSIAMQVTLDNLEKTTGLGRVNMIELLGDKMGFGDFAPK